MINWILVGAADGVDLRTSGKIWRRNLQIRKMERARYLPHRKQHRNLINLEVEV